MARDVGLRPISSEADLRRWILESRDRERRRVRVAWADWIDVLAAFHGRHDIVVSRDLRVMQRLTPRQEKELERIAVNLVQPHVRTVAALHQKARPILDCLPATSDEADIQAAKVGDRLLRSEWRRQRMDIRRLEMATWAAATGNAFWHVIFDSTSGPEAYSGVPIGEIETETVSPFKVVVEPHRTSIDRARWCIIDQMMPLDWLQATYADVYRRRTGEELRLSKQDTAGRASAATGSGGELGLGEMLASMIGMPGRDDSFDDEFIETVTLYHLPSPRFPHGLFVILAGEKMLHVGPYPHKDVSSGRALRWLPVLHFRDVLCPWRLMGDSSAIQVKQAQDLYNNLRNIEVTSLRDMAAAKWLTPRGCNVDKDALLSRDPEVVEYVAREGAAPPQRLSGGGPPTQLYHSMQLARDEGMRSSGVNEATHGALPEGALSGRAVLALQEQDATRLGSTVQLAEEEYGRWGSIVLAMAKQYYIEPRKYQIAGEGRAHGVWYFDRADLRDTTDVICQAGSAMPLNKVARQENVLTMFRLGVLGDPASQEAQVRVRRMLEFGNESDLFDDDAMDEGVAEKENDALVELTSQLISAGVSDPTMVHQMISAMGITPQRWDNHMSHLKVHLRRFKAPGVRDNPLLSQVVQLHIDAHMDMMRGVQQSGGQRAAIESGAEQPATGMEQILQDKTKQDQVAPQGVATPIPRGGETARTMRSDLQILPSETPGQ